MIVQHKNIKLILLVLLIGISHLAVSQSQGKYYNKVSIAAPSGSSSSGLLSFDKPCTNFNVREGKVWLKIDLGDQYQFGSSTAGNEFDISVNVDLALVTTGASTEINFILNLNNNKPESVLYLDLNQYVDLKNTVSGMSYLGESITGVQARINSAVDNKNNVDIQANLKTNLHYEIVYGIDVSSHQITNLVATKDPNNKVVNFSWQNACDAPNYEFQLLRLFNRDEALVVDEKHIKTTVDWSKALTFNTYGHQKEISITIGEGQGFYVWRVRPIGTFYKNSSGNNNNWGSWNAPQYTSLNNEFQAPIASGISDTFFFTDADDDKNYQYSRVFTEGNKISEQVTYATTLNQIKQTQRYFPSKDYKIVSQTVLDKSGRPTLTTLPVPIEGKKIDQYKTNFVVTNKELYRAKHFDEESNYKKPSKVDFNDSGNAFRYYSSMNSDKRVPDAEGYPFTRVIFSNDGTDRVVEKSGVGKTHMIGDQSEGQGRTVRTLYGTPTEEELVALFGDEAPAPENTSKVTTIDPNNTKSIAYITKDGNTIATGLTFSEDEAVLDKIQTGPKVSGKIDKITNNIRTSDGFKASKRITVLEDNTEINLNYTITKPIIEGLCNNLEIDLDYKLIIEVFDVETNKVYNNYRFEVESVKESASNSPSDDNVIIDFGNITLNTGTYYVQKTLIPADKVNAQLVESRENIERLISPYFNWLLEALDKVDCEEEMQVLYNDIFLFGQVVHGQELKNSVTSGVFKFICEGCSESETLFLEKISPDAPDEFLDFYEEKSDDYEIIIYYLEDGKLKNIDFNTQSSIGETKIAAVKFITPCCEFEIPIGFSPPFRKPSPEALDAYKNDAEANARLNESKDYYTNNTVSTQTEIYPNYEYLYDKSKNFTYSKAADGTITLENTKAYPLDFEGYAVSMLYQCRSSSDTNYGIEDAKQEFYNSIRGWHKPGLLNQMVYHMATDNHGANGCKNLVDGTGGIKNPKGIGSSTTNSNKGYQICDAPKEPVYLNGAQYSIKELTECWESIVLEMINEICVQGLEAEINQSSNIASNVDQQNNDRSITNDHLNDNIGNWIVRWISKRKLRRRVRRQTIGETGNIEDEIKNIRGNLVRKFLDCTGYAFADIIEDPASPQSSFSDLATDFNTDIQDGEYDKTRLLNTALNNEGEDWGYFRYTAPENGEKNYFTKAEYEALSDTNKPTLIKDVFKRLQDPVYAYKYYVYQNEFPDLEARTCYRDPNICKDENGNEVPCCGGTLADPVPCNFCGVGYINCPYTKSDWSCNQRLTFYNLLKLNKEVKEEKGVVLKCSNFYESKEYVKNPYVNNFIRENGDDDTNDGLSDVAWSAAQFDAAFRFNDPTMPRDALYGIPYLTKEIIDEYIEEPTKFYDKLKDDANYNTVELNNILGQKQTSMVSIIENDAYAMQKECTDNCDERREEFKEDLIKAFTDRCYIIGECKIDRDDNIIPIADIEAMVDKIVSQCKNQCSITTYSCNDEPCRSTSTSIYEYGTNPVESSTSNTTYIDYGVSGPINGSSSRNEKLIVNDANGNTINTGISFNTPIQNISETGGLLEKYSFTYAPYVSIWDVRRSLTYAEYSRWVQAMQWEIDLNIPSKCDIEGKYNPTIQYNKCGIPDYEKGELVYVYVDNQWVVQDLSMFKCDQTEQDLEYISRANPNGKQDTFIDRDKYIKDKSTPPTPDDADFKEAVKSKKIDIKLKIDN